MISADRIGKGIRTAPRDAMISAATPPESLGLAFGVHRALDTDRRRDRAADRLRRALVDPGRLPDRDGHLVRLRGRSASPCWACWCRTAPSAAEPRARPAAPASAGATSPTPGCVRLLVVAGVLGLLTVGDGFIYLALLDRGGFAAHWFPLLYVGTNIAYLALAIPIGRLADRVGRARS